jgi:hypothetical protein
MALIRNTLSVLALVAAGAKAQTPAPWPGVGACTSVSTGTACTARHGPARARRAAARSTAARGG